MNAKKVLLCIGVVALLGTTAARAWAQQDPVTRDQWNQLKDEVAQLRQRVDRLAENAKNNTAQIGQLSSNLTSMSDEINQQLTKQQQILQSLVDLTERLDSVQQSIAATDPQGQAFLRLDSIMDKSTAGREQVRRAVDRSLRKEGTLTIHNKMGTDQDVLVNGVQYRVMAGGTLTLNVAVGNVSTRLPGQEIVNWAISPPSYAQSIDIVPKHQTWRPASATPATTTVMAPVVEMPVTVAPAVTIDPLTGLPLYFYP